MISPSLREWDPMQQRRNVLLPAPFGPIRQYTLPGWNVSDTPLTGVIPPKRLTTARASRLPSEPCRAMR